MVMGGETHHPLGLSVLAHGQALSFCPVIS
nr:MAG TPA: hypothetical protein [Caudoviricetes sp.]